MNIKSFLRVINLKFEIYLKQKFLDKYFYKFALAKLRNRNFSIICNNCLAGGIYHKFGLIYSTPTIGLFFFSEDYIRFLEDFEHYINQPLTFIDKSIYSKANDLRMNHHYPIGMLGNGVEVHFLHYKDIEEAKSKWTRRIERLNYNNLFFIYSDGGGAVAGAGEHDFKEDYINRFEKLPYERKIFFSSKPRKGKSVVLIKDYINEMHVGDSTLNRKYEKYINITKWLNGEQNFLKNKVDSNG